MSLEIERLLGIASLQSTDAPARRRFGVPPGGPFDRESAVLANALVGNGGELPVLELSNALLTARMDSPMTLACVGTAIDIQLDDRAVPCQSQFHVAAGQTMELSAPHTGTRAYLAVAGGWHEDDFRTAGRLTARSAGRSVRSPLRLAREPASMRRDVLRCVAGPQSSLFPDDGWLRSLWTVSAMTDRVGVRLTGSPFSVSGELPSEPACPGAIQVSNDGQPIILGPDGPTIGGYPKIAVVCTADLDKVAQLRPGDTVSFKLVSLEAALDLAIRASKDLVWQVEQIRIAVGK